RHAVRGTEADDVLYVLGRLRKHYGVRRLVLDPGRGVGMLLAYRLGGDDAIAKARRKRAHDGVDGLRVAGARRLFDLGHRLVSCAGRLAADVPKMKARLRRQKLREFPTGIKHAR